MPTDPPSSPADPVRAVPGLGLPPLLVDTRTAARTCGVSLATWYRLTAAGKIGPTPLRLGGRVLWRAAELAEWIEAGCPDRRTWQALTAQRNGRR